jgi:hypothetical protein
VRSGVVLDYCARDNEFEGGRLVGCCGFGE